VLRRLLEEAALGAEAGVGEGDVELAEGVERRLHHRLLLSEIRDIARNGNRALGASQLFGERFELVGATGGEHDPVTGVGRMTRGRRADATRGAGDEEDGVGHGHSFAVDRYVGRV